MATPNQEQQKAITHTGGVLLKAGAGSGKTFVLKEHLIYLSHLMISEARSEALDLDQFQIRVKQKFRRIVLMTFTKKAAGELNIRLVKEFNSLRKTDSADRKYWEVIYNQLSFLNVSTIHGFCFKLISLGVFPGVSGDQNILSASEFKDKVQTLCANHLETNLSELDSQIRELVLKERKNIFSSVQDIFSDPTLRYAWSKLKIEDLESGIPEVMKTIFQEYSLSELFQNPIRLELFSDCTGKTWYDFLIKFKPLLDSYDYTLEKTEQLINSLNELKFRIPNRPKADKFDEAIVSYYDLVVGLKDFLKSNATDLLEFQNNHKTGINSWLNFIMDLVKSVERDYGKSPGITFSDMEYIVFNCLQDPKVSELIQSEFDYFIVDEFQDTSFIQYSIIENITNKNMNKLFCVGDLKQAIYGFRGGELGVFLNCAENIPLNLSLKNNYRSSTDIIRFNNLFFEYLFKLGPKFEGIDPHTVEVEHQTPPEGLLDQGKIEKIVIDAPLIDSKYSTLQTDYIEALGIRSKIISLLANGESCAVLYKKLKPSLILVNLLMEQEISFSAQVKIPFLEDPVTGIFVSLIEKDLNISEGQDAYQFLILKSYLHLLGAKRSIQEIEDEVAQFSSERHYYGLYQAFCNFLYRGGIRSSNIKNNLEFLKVLIHSKGSNSSTLYKIIKEERENTYSVEFEYGDNPNQIKLMSAHGSKGLQFQNVILGGIFTNDKSMPMRNLIGKMPFSFKWVDSIYGKNKFKTPHYILEEILTKNKEFSENKRLFYVACTRAESGLFWVDINWGDNKRTSSGSSTWSSGIQKWEMIQKTLKIAENTFEIEKEFNETFLSQLENRPPFFHTDNLGIVIAENSKSVSLLSELSVTKLALITGCPRKFYFDTICKITDQEIELLERPETEVTNVIDQSDELSSNDLLKSSAARGSEIHEYLSELILSDFSTLEEAPIHLNWIVDKLKDHRDKFQLISEKPIKFELFGYMISGIPDLILQAMSEEDQFAIWDFKTGHYSEDKVKPYYFQLMVYAYSQYELGVLDKKKPCNLVLQFVDDKKMVEYLVHWGDVEKYLSEELEKINRPELKNLELCKYCKFAPICEK